MLANIVRTTIANHCYASPGRKVKFADLLALIRVEAARHKIDPLRRDVALAVEAAGFPIGMYKNVQFVGNLSMTPPASLTVCDGKLTK